MFTEKHREREGGWDEHNANVHLSHFQCEMRDYSRFNVLECRTTVGVQYSNEKRFHLSIWNRNEAQA